MTSLLDGEFVFVGRIDEAPIEALGDRILKAVFEVAETDSFSLYERRDEVLEMLHWAHVRESLLNEYYQGIALLFASPQALETLPIFLEPGRAFWLLGHGEYFPLEAAAAGNWSDGDAVLAAKGVVGAQIYRLEALYLGATHGNGQSAATRRDAIHQFCTKQIRPRLEGLLRSVGSRGRDQPWDVYVGELRDEFGAPVLRKLYGEPEGRKARLGIGTEWQREGRASAPAIKDLTDLDDSTQTLGREAKQLQFAADMLARAVIQERQGVAVANREGMLHEESMAAIIDIYSEPNLERAAEAAFRWDINPARYFQRLGAFSGFFDAVRSLGIHSRLQQVQLPALASFGIRALMRSEADALFNEEFVRLRCYYRGQMPSRLVDEAESAPREVPDSLFTFR